MATDELNGSGGEDTGPLFPDISGDDTNDVVQLESLCMNCHENGSTKLLLTKIPFFREIIVSSFHCDECGFRNTGFQSAGRIQDKGVKISAQITTAEDLNRQVVRSDCATFSIPVLSFEHPPTKKGEISTVEGLIDHVKAGLMQDQPVRKIMQPEVAEMIEEFVHKIDALKRLEEPFEIVIDDPSGNSFVENPMAPQKDEHMTVTHYNRTHQQDIDVGVVAEGDDDETPAANFGNQDEEKREHKADEATEGQEEKFSSEVLTFRTNCPSCNAPCGTNMKIQDIPFFKEVVIMATTCDLCGFRDNEVKSGTGIEDKGTRIKLKITDPSDLNRDVLKSDTCGVKIPELDLELGEGTLGGRFTTVEGLLTNIRDQLGEKNPFITGDSSNDGVKRKMEEFCSRLDKVIQGETLNVHLILDDPAGNSYLQNVYAPEPDPELEITHYERTDEENDILGLREMKVEDYAENS